MRPCAAPTRPATTAAHSRYRRQASPKGYAEAPLAPKTFAAIWAGAGLRRAETTTATPPAAAASHAHAKANGEKGCAARTPVAKTEEPASQAIS